MLRILAKLMYFIATILIPKMRCKQNIYGLVFLLGIAGIQPAKGQQVFDAKTFFTNDTVLQVTLSTNIRNLTSGKIKTEEQKAMFTVSLPGGTTFTEEIRVRPRGVMRRKICNLPPLKLNFNNPASTRLKSLKSLKLVNCCHGGSNDEQLLLKEYLIYKMFNLLTDKSFRARLLYMTYEDSAGRKKTNSQYAFFVEDVDAMAKRNNCLELNNRTLNSSATDREQMTLIAIFQYMVGNTDWSVPNNQNIKLILPKDKTNGQPFVVPYDFDYAGLVNADYAAPAEILPIESVKQRLYRGFARTMDELKTVIQLFNQQKESIYALVNNCEPLKSGSKKEIINYLDEFYATINNDKKVHADFIQNARSQ